MYSEGIVDEEIGDRFVAFINEEHLKKIQEVHKETVVGKFNVDLLKQGIEMMCESGSTEVNIIAFRRNDIVLTAGTIVVESCNSLQKKRVMICGKEEE